MRAPLRPRIFLVEEASDVDKLVSGAGTSPGRIGPVSLVFLALLDAGMITVDG